MKLKLFTIFRRMLTPSLRKDAAETQPMLPAGSVDTKEYYEQLEKDVEQLDSLLGKDPNAFRRMQLYSYYRKGDGVDFNELIPALSYKIRLCNHYLLNYYIMYRLLIPALLEHKIEEMRMLVLGCGSMIDALSLSYALKEHEGRIAVNYTGVDIAAWPSGYKTPFEKHFVQKPLQDWWDSVDVVDENVIFFSTVLSELREYPDETEKLCRGLEQATFKSDTIFLLVSYRSTASYKRDWKLTDWQKMQRVITAIEKKGYQAEPAPVAVPQAWQANLFTDYARDEGDREWPCYYLANPYTENGAIDIRELAPDFAVPDYVIEYLNDPGYIRKHCSYYQGRRDQYHRQHPEEDVEKENLLKICRQQCPINCKPMPKTHFSTRHSPCFQIIIFRRTHTA